MSTLVALKPAKRQPLGHAVADSLREAIYSGRFRPGQRIGQVSVAQELGVSQTTVRDALTALERDGLVERAVNQGAVVTQLSREDIEEITSLRVELESMAARRLIQQANAAHFSALEDNVRNMKAVAAPEDVADLDLQFHELLIRLAGHKRLLSCWLMLRTQIKLLMVTHNLRNPRSPEDTVQNHRELLEILRSGDAEAAVAHIKQANVAHLVDVAS
jgi:DNA-binding GntR family transcriptional regulator